ncbi:MAG: putative rane protein, partial [Pseudonocardiales bacterium]|nr:putative rane protein [Pseudonocardiales bacterium]
MWSAGTLLLSEESEHPVTIVANILVGIVALIHVYIVVLEMVLWKTPRVRAAFGTTEEFAEQSAPLVANQGLYNGFLA